MPPATLPTPRPLPSNNNQSVVVLLRLVLAILLTTSSTPPSDHSLPDLLAQRACIPARRLPHYSSGAAEADIPGGGRGLLLRGGHTGQSHVLRQPAGPHQRPDAATGG